MSDSLAIAAVTSTLRALLENDPDLAGTFVTTRPPDKARPDGDGENRLNVFCYRASMNGAWRNTDLPGRVHPGELAPPLLPLDLHYVVTAYGLDSDELLGNRMLGRAMRILHDHPVLLPAQLAAALPDSDLHDQVERVRLTFEPLSVDDLSKVWGAFQTEYRFSVYYQAAVILIEGTRPSTAPLPVLARGAGDRGPTSQPDLVPPFPTLLSVTPPDGQPSAAPGDLVTLEGHHLAGDAVEVRFASRRLRAPLVVIVEPGATATQARVRAPDAPADAPAGEYAVTVAVTREGRQRISEPLPLALAPRVEAVAPAGPLPAGDLTLTVTPRPQVRLDQQVALLFGSRELRPAARTDQADPLVFAFGGVAAGTYLVRLRIDGVDSLAIDHTATPPTFLASQRVTVQ